MRIKKLNLHVTNSKKCICWIKRSLKWWWIVFFIKRCSLPLILDWQLLHMCQYPEEIWIFFKEKNKICAANKIHWLCRIQSFKFILLLEFRFDGSIFTNCIIFFVYSPNAKKIWPSVYLMSCRSVRTQNMIWAFFCKKG